MQFIDICTQFAHWLLPQDCLLCGIHCGQQHLCDGCRGDLPYHRTPCCPVCAMPSPQSEICGSCLKQPPYFDATQAAFVYDFPVNALLRAFKYHGRLEIGEMAGESLAQHITASSNADVLIPMPMHHQRLRERGFNQATEIARIISARTGIPLMRELALRVKATEPQASLAIEKRRQNMRGAFACTEDLTGKHIAVVDDVMTSGASLDELAKTLKASGAARVECWVVARTLKS